MPCTCRRNYVSLSHPVPLAYLGKHCMVVSVYTSPYVLYYIANKAARIPCRCYQLRWPLFILITTKIRQLCDKAARVTTKFDVTVLSWLFLTTTRKRDLHKYNLHRYSSIDTIFLYSGGRRQEFRKSTGQYYRYYYIT